MYAAESNFRSRRSTGTAGSWSEPFFSSTCGDCVALREIPARLLLCDWTASVCLPCPKLAPPLLILTAAKLRRAALVRPLEAAGSWQRASMISDLSLTLTHSLSLSLLVPCRAQLEVVFGFPWTRSSKRRYIRREQRGGVGLGQLEEAMAEYARHRWPHSQTTVLCRRWGDFHAATSVNDSGWWISALTKNLYSLSSKTNTQIINQKKVKH